MNKKRSLTCILSIFFTLAITLSILLPSQVASADSTITVTTTTDGTGGPDCTLRDAIRSADIDYAIGGCPAGSGADTIILANGATYTLMTEDLPAIHSQITIEGNDAIIERSYNSGTPEFRIFYVSADGNLTLNKLTVRNGDSEHDGGGIKNWGTLTINDSTISGNVDSGISTLEGSKVYIYDSNIIGNSGGNCQGGIRNNRGSVVIYNSNISGNGNSVRGGGINNYLGSVDIYNSTISNNSATLVGGGIYNREGVLNLTNSTVSSNSGGGINNNQGSVFVNNSTISGNLAVVSGGGIYNYAGEGGIVTLANTIVAKQLSGIDCYGDWVTSLGYNLDSDGSCNLTSTGDISGVDPLLGPLGDHGGPTWTHALLEGSPALDVVPTWECQQDTDQRGVSRPQGLACDMGAFELEQTEVFIDIKPGSDPSCFNNDGNGVIPVAILGNSDFDVYTIDPASVSLEGLAIAAKGKSNKLLAAYDDVNGDGITDLVIKIEDIDGVFTQGSGTAILNGSLYDGTLIFGVDDICLVP